MSDCLLHKHNRNLILTNLIFSFLLSKEIFPFSAKNSILCELFTVATRVYFSSVRDFRKLKGKGNQIEVLLKRDFILIVLRKYRPNYGFLSTKSY